jgi:glycosyltransferase involved in cell wall biosynthesis
MFNSPFGSQKSERTFNEETRFVFVSDLFVEDYVGGAELTSQALIDSSPLPIETIKSSEVDLKSLENGHDKYWIFGNFTGMNPDLIPTIVANMEYSVLEYDYKYCKYRSPEKHKAAEKIDCNCHNEMTGKMISAFYHGAKSLWWMSEDQMSRYHRIFPFLSEKDNVVLSSVFDDKFFYNVKQLREKNKDVERKGWIVLGSNSWIKGAEAAENWCKENNKDYEVVWNLPYEEVLEKLSKAEGFVYLPEGGDTCPRMVIEAKLLGCKLHLNENVQHAKEIWFDTDDMFDTEAYLYAARSRFWNALRATMEWKPTISGYTTTKDCISQKYPFEQSVKSMLGFADEVVVVDGGSTDGTWELLEEWSKKETRLKVYRVERDWNHKRHAVFDGLQKAEARSRCTGDFLWQMDSDEIVHEDHYEKIIALCKNFPENVDLISLPVIEYWGGPEKVRMDINPWKWRLSRNKDYITHGIPAQLRRTDENGDLYSMPGSDGCDYVHSESFELIPHASFYTQEVHNARMAAVSGNKEAQEGYQRWFNSVIDQLPGVHHYSWFDLERKILTYKNYWSRHWQSLYNIEQEDSVENNMFFEKKWSDVTDEDITSLSNRLKTEMGGWIFHQKVDFERPTPHLNLSQGQPSVMREND